MWDKHTHFEKVNPKQSFPELEENMLKFWQENKIFEASIENRADAEEFNFYDGPPFATGTPHYGHILAGTIKDVIPRYQTMKGKKVERRFGWDTHGLPIENIVEKKLNIQGKDDIEQNIGVHKFNEECRANVFGYANEWRKSVERMGRWVDMDNDYKTMDTDFMESVWWVYAELYKKWLIYEGHRVVPYSVWMSTPLSNFEVNQGYQDKQDKTVTVKFKIRGNENKYILAWTTTPWTLVANLWLAVWADIDYVELLDNKNNETYILARDRISEYYKNEDDYVITREYKWTCLEWIKYEPVYPDFDPEVNPGVYETQGFSKWNNTHSVVIGHHVTTESGTGIVHIAPAYGEDDYQIGKEHDLGFAFHINDSWKTYNLLENNGVWVFDYNEKAIEELKEKSVVLKISTINHSYPHCWRSGVPLIYRAISAWYVNVEKIKDQMVANNQKINWTPEDIKDGRFGTWIANARDWNISRNRYWGSAIPVWQNEDKTEELCIGSVEDMYQHNKDFGDITKVIFVRHGRTDYNLEGKLDFEGKAQLVDAGKKQAQEIAKIFENEDIAAVYSSPLQRCVDTISPLADSKNLDVQTIENFGEIKATDLQDQTFDCKNFKWDNGFGGGEKVSEVFDRVQESLQDIVSQNKGKTIVICSHGDPTFLTRMGLHNNIDYDTQKYTCGKYLENNPEKHSIDAMYGVEYVYTKTNKAVDIHKHFVDEIKLKNPETGNTLSRVPEVLDCWFESGSMPYASKHFPFENNTSSQPSPLKEKGQEHWNSPLLQGRGAGGEGSFKFPADFIAEGLDQTRGWFYTLLILGTALFDNTPFLNCIVNGIVLAEDGKKMSKSLKNYPDPSLIFDKYGADAMRFYLMNSPVVEAQDFRFAEAGVEEVVKKVILPLWNTYYFFTTYANIDNFEPKGLPTNLDNNLDKWLISELNTLTRDVSGGFDSYKLADAARPIVKFMDNLTNWYIRRSRKRFWKTENDGDKLQAYETLNYVLVETTKIIAPFMPFISEHMYKNLTGNTSVHLTDYPVFNDSAIDEKLNADTDRVQKIITLGLAWRANNKIRVRQPLASITITESLDNYYLEIIKEELNVKEVLVVDGNTLAKQICKPNGRAIGPKFGKDVKFIMSEAKAGNFELLPNGDVKVGHFELESGDFELVFEAGDTGALIEAGFGMVIAMDDTITEELKLEGYYRDIVRHIQEARKEADYNVDDRISVHVAGATNVVESFKTHIESETLSTVVNSIDEYDVEKNLEIDDLQVVIRLKK